MVESLTLTTSMDLDLQEEKNERGQFTKKEEDWELKIDWVSVRLL